MEKKLFEGIAINYSGRQTKYYTHAANAAQAKIQIRKKFNKENGRLPNAFVRVEEVKEVTKKKN